MVPQSAVAAWRRTVALALLLLAIAVRSTAPGRAIWMDSESGSSQAVPTVLEIDVVVVDRRGAPIDGLGPGDFVVTVDGRPRAVRAVRRLSRGPGAVGEAISRMAAVADPLSSFAAEPSRSIVVAIDQATIAPGDERPVIRAAAALLDRLGIEDRVAVVRLPMAFDTLVMLTTDRPEAQDALGLVRGQAAAAVTADQAGAGLDAARQTAVDPDRDRTTDPERRVEEVSQTLVADVDRLERSPDADPATIGHTFGGLQALMATLRSVPGRKTIVLLSAGFVRVTAGQVRQAAAAAAAARVVVHAIGVRGAWGDLDAAPDPAPLEALATATGGVFSTLGRNPESNVEQVTSRLALGYVLEIEPAPTGEADGRPRSLSVETTRKNVRVHAPSWSGPTVAATDVVPAAPTTSAVEVPSAAGESRAKPAAPSERDLELQTALARVSDYVAGYERLYSGLVAEEEYRQMIRQQSRLLRSDFLLVKPDEDDRWVSFRDVFEVDGKAVRDRDDRLKRLFLDPAPESAARLKEIKNESARFNIGPLLRNINVPLLPLEFLGGENRSRFAYRLSAGSEVDGIDTWRLDYVERHRPTIISDDHGGDVPSEGWFRIDRGTGAIVETRLRLTQPGYTASIVVSYRRDPALGMWVPARMREDYQFAGALVAPSPIEYWGARSMEGEATYSKYRRFQVKTEVTVAVPKK